MGNSEGVLREISEAVTAARALMGNCYPSMGRQLSETSALLVLQKHTKETHLSSLVQNGFVNLFCNSTLKAVRTYSLQGNELQKMK